MSNYKKHFVPLFQICTYPPFTIFYLQEVQGVNRQNILTKLSTSTLAKLINIIAI